MKFKNLLVGVLALSTLVLSGCGSSGETSTDSGTDTDQPHEHTYEFKEFEWTETPGAYTAKAKYVCSGDETHVEKYDATMSKTTDAPTCSVAGANHWKAVYKTHEDTKDEVLAATGVHTADEHGFCTSGGEYLKDQKAIETDFEVNADVEYLFRVPIEANHHYYFEIDGNNLQGLANTTSVYLKKSTGLDKVSGIGAFIDEDELGSGHTPTFIEIGTEVGDGYLYVELKEADNSGIHLIMTAKNEHLLDTVGYCVCCGHYEGTLENIDTNLDLGEETTPGHHHMSTDDVAYFKFVAAPQHTYALWKDHIAKEEVVFYYQSLVNGEYIELVRESSMFTTPIASVFDGYVYCVVAPIMANDDAYINMHLVGHSTDCSDEYGFCTYHTGNYTGDTISNNGTYTEGITLDYDSENPEKAFFRFAIEVGHSYTFFDPTDDINFACYAAYLRNPTTGQMDLVTLTSHALENSNDTPQFDYVGDGYLYLVITAKFGNINNAELEVTTVHYYDEYGFCVGCNTYRGTELAHNETSDPFTLLVNEQIYFSHEVEDDSDPNIVLEYNNSLVGSTVSEVFVKRDGEIVALEYNGAASDQSRDEYYMPGSQDPLAEGEVVYIIITNNQGSTMSNWTITLTEE